jgi:hypothetical protein
MTAPLPAAPVLMRADVVMATAFGVAAILLAVAQSADLIASVAVAACVGGLAAMRNRLVAGFAALALLVLVISRGVDVARAIDCGAASLLGYVVILPGHLPKLTLKPIGWGLIIVVLACLAAAGQIVESGGASAALTCVAAIVAAIGGYSLATCLVSPPSMASVAQYSLNDGQWLTATTRYLLLGRIAGGMSHELSQALNVITMANGNLGYILDRVSLPEQQGRQLTERVRKIATHADAAGRILSLYRWFGQDGGRELNAEMTVGSALERAVGATRALARKSGVSIEMRGDGLNHPVPLRHGTIELMTAAALLEVLQRLAARPVGSAVPEPIVLEATRTQTDIEISVLCRTIQLPAAEASDDVARATYDLVAKLAASCRGELRRVGSEGYPVQFLLRLNRDLV